MSCVHKPPPALLTPTLRHLHFSVLSTVPSPNHSRDPSPTHNSSFPCYESQRPTPDPFAAGVM